MDQPNSKIISELNALIEANQVAAPIEHAWAKKIEENSFSEAVSGLEEELSNKTSNHLARLWWINCQLELGSVPANALSAPIEEMFQSLIEQDELKPIGKLTLLRLAKRLFAREQTRLGVLMLERVLELEDDNNSQNNINQALIEGLELEHERAKVRRENPTYLGSVKDKISLYSNNKKKKKNTDKPLEEKIITSKSIIKNKEEKSPEKPEKKKKELPKLFALLPKKVSKKHLYAIGACLWIVVLFNFFGAADKKIEASNLNTFLPPNKPLSLPETSLASAHVSSPNSKLERLSSRLERMESVEQTEAPEDRSAIVKTSYDDSKTSNANFDYQIENQTSATIRPVPGKTPNLNPSKLSKTKVENISSNVRSTNVKDLFNDREDTKPKKVKSNTPKDNDIKVGFDNDKRPEHKEVIVLDRVQNFRTITNTHVFSAPSLAANKVANLEPNTIVRATKKMGIWLEVRSLKGETGYVYSQDALPMR